MAKALTQHQVWSSPDEDSQSWARPPPVDRVMEFLTSPCQLYPLVKVTMIRCDVDITFVGVCQKRQRGKPWSKDRTTPVGPPACLLCQQWPAGLQWQEKPRSQDIPAAIPRGQGSHQDSSRSCMQGYLGRALGAKDDAHLSCIEQLPTCCSRSRVM